MFKRLVILSTFCIIVGARTSDASPITWLYTGVVGSTFDQSLLPVGSPAPTLLTADPQSNIWAGFNGCGSHPEGAAYYIDAKIDLDGQQYDLTAALEVNYDFTFCQANPGAIRIAPFGVNGPPIGPFSPTGPQGGAFNGYIAGGTDPTSPAFPSSSNLVLLMNFGFSSGSQVRIGLSNPEVVPEPSALLLMSSGLALVLRRRRRTAPLP